MHCPQCRHLNSENAKFCEECGVHLITACLQCGQQGSPTAKFCPACGTALTRGQKGKRRNGEKTKEERTKRRRGETAKGKSSSSEFRLPNSRVQSSVGERRQLTVMFIDLVGSTALSARLDPEDYQAVVQTYQRTCAEVIARFDGSIAQYLGDGVLAYFGYPTAHEDDAQRAVRAGLEIITSIQEKVLAPLARENQAEGALEATYQLQIRIGIHMGPVVVGEIGSVMKREQFALGEAPNIAARIQGIAEPNTVAVSGATYRLVSSFFACQDLGV